MDSIPTMACLHASSTSHNPSSDLSTCVLASIVFWFMRCRWDSYQLNMVRWRRRLGIWWHWGSPLERLDLPGSGHKSKLSDQENMTNADSTQPARILQESNLVVELDSRGSSQGSGDRDAENQILDDGGTSHRFVRFRITTKEFKSQASFGLKYQDEFNINNASCLMWLSPEFFGRIQEPKFQPRKVRQKPHKKTWKKRVLH